MTDSKIPNEFEWNGKTYTSIRDAAADTGLTYVQVYYRVVIQGYKSEDEVVTYDDRRKAVTWNGKTYKSIRHAAKARGISRSAMQNRIRKGYSKDSDLKVTPSTPVRVDDKVYRSLNQAVRELSEKGMKFSEIKNKAQEMKNTALVSFAVMPVLIRRYKAGELTHTQVKKHLRANGMTWGQFVDAMQEQEGNNADV